ncbi:MAG: LacI family transcriptional regulator [Glaciihabitans sp.]|jgi:LacI family transcriptional regulator|nr:LacI family transcriptional regulator [Glaciihabitans sp.]MDQ1570154.1 LacI family transcriptional regulator [Actinomycetota bacterium]
MAAANVKDVAALAGVSLGTVSNVLNRPEIVSPETADRVMQAIEKLGFVRNDAARQLKAGRSNTIGLVVLDVRNPFFTDLARGAEDGAGAAGLSILLGDSGRSHERETAYLDLFEEQRVHGVLVSPLSDVARRLEGLRRRGIPAVLVDRSGTGSGFSSVSVDDVAGGRLAVEHLISIGRRRIAYLAGSFDFSQVTDRLRGAREAVASHPGTTLEVIDIGGLTVLEGRAAGERIVARAADDRPDGIFTANDLIAVGVLQALVMQSDIRVPGDVALVGYDDIDFAQTAVVPLSSVRQPSALLGRTAVEILLDEARDPTLQPRQIVFQPELVIRASTVP